MIVNRIANWEGIEILHFNNNPVVYKVYIRKVWRVMYELRMYGSKLLWCRLFNI